MTVRFLCLFATLATLAPSATFRVNGTALASWPKIFASVGIAPSDRNDAEIVVAGPNSDVDAAAVSSNHVLILEGMSPAAASLGFSAKSASVSIRQICDTHAPNMQIFWEQPVSVPQISVPADFQVFATEKWQQMP